MKPNCVQSFIHWLLARVGAPENVLNFFAIGPHLPFVADAELRLAVR